MEKIVIAGIDSSVGANLAAWLSDHFQIVGFSLSGPVSISGCETAVCDGDDPEEVRGRVASARPQWIVYCGPASRSTWDGPTVLPGAYPAAQLARPWAQAAAALDCELTVVSSDAVFTGPWMFHDEEGTCFCPSPAAQEVRDMEREVAAVCPRALIVRTNAFGWSPLPQSAGVVERILTGGDSPQSGVDFARHATPILATDLAEILEKACRRQLHGLYHIGGGERVNPFRFGALLADRFGCGFSTPVGLTTLMERRTAFGCGETSLQGRKIKHALGISLPLLSEGLHRLYTQSINGFRDRFDTREPLVREMVA